MKRLKRFLALGSVTLLVVGMIAFYVFQTVTERQLAEQLAQVEKPASMAFYEAVVASRQGEDSGGDRSAAPRSLSTPAVESDEGDLLSNGPSSDLARAEETIAHYARVLGWGEERPEEFNLWKELLDSVRKKRYGEWSAAERAQLEDFVSANQDLIGEIRALAERGGPVYPLDLSQGLEIELPHLAPMRDLVRLLRADALVQASHGHIGEAMEDLVAGMKLADALSDEPILISQLVRIAMTGIVYDTFQEAFDWGEVPPELAGELVRDAAQSDERNAFADSLLGEQYSGLSLFSQLQESAWFAGFEQLGEYSTDGLGRLLYTSPVGQPWMQMDQRDYAEALSSMASAARLPYYEAEPLLEQMDADIENLPWTRLLSRTMLPALIRATQTQAQHEAQLDLLQIGVALEEQYARLGEYPATLEEIASALGGTVPVDPFTGDAYHYTPRGERFTLYSVGRDLTDNGGVHDYRDGDIVWRGEEKRDIKVARKSD